MKHTIKMDVLKAKVTLLVGEYDKIKRHIPYGLTSFDEAGYLARTTYRRVSGTKYPFQVIIHSRSAAISVIAHEAVHAACFIMDGTGVAADNNNDELQAYIVQHICQEAENSLNVYDAGS